MVMVVLWGRGGGGEGGKPSLLPFLREKPWTALGEFETRFSMSSSKV